MTPIKLIHICLLSSVTICQWACSPQFHTASQPLVPLVQEKNEVLGSMRFAVSGPGAQVQYCPANRFVLAAQIEGMQRNYTANNLFSSYRLYRSSYATEASICYLANQRKGQLVDFPMILGAGFGKTVQTEISASPVSQVYGRNIHFFFQPGLRLNFSEVQLYMAYRNNFTKYLNPEIDGQKRPNLALNWGQLTGQLTVVLSEKFYLGGFGTLSVAQNATVLMNYTAIYPGLNFGLVGGINFNKHLTKRKTDE